MTMEELQAELEELKSGNEALAAKNKELIAEKRKLQAKTNELDLDAYNKALDENETLKVSYEKLKKQYESETSKLSDDLAKKDSFLNKTILTDGLSKSLLEAGIDKQFLPAALAMLEKQAKVVQDGENYNAMINDKIASEFVSEWVAQDGKIFTMKTPDTGAGANGGAGGQQSTGGNLAGSKAEQEAYIKAKFNL